MYICSKECARERKVWDVEKQRTLLFDLDLGGEPLGRGDDYAGSLLPLAMSNASHARHHVISKVLLGCLHSRRKT